MPNETRTPDLPDEYLREIGRVVVSWNRIENLLHHTLVLALQDNFAQDARVIAVFAHMAFPQKLDTLRAMLLISQSSTGQVFIDYQEKIQPLLKTCQEKRNNILHQSWSVDNGIVQRFDIKARGVFKATRLDVSLADLADTTALMVEAQQLMFALVSMPLVPKSDPQEGQ
jgi:hypothetical protein